jgi:hypothetical protein
MQLLWSIEIGLGAVLGASGWEGKVCHLSAAQDDEGCVRFRVPKV